MSIAKPANRDVEELLFVCGVIVTYETIRRASVNRASDGSTPQGRPSIACGKVIWSLDRHLS
jgi:hypothetical protein